MINEINSITPKPNITGKKIYVENSGHKDIESADTKRTNRKYDSIEVNKLIADNEKRINDFKETIRRMIAKQGQVSNLTLFGHKLNVSLEDSEKAAASIAEGGEYSIDAVATRIMEMAKALSGGDKSKISLLRDSVIKGFEAAGMELNGGAGLPEISHKTYDEIMKRFDQWESE